MVQKRKTTAATRSKAKAPAKKASKLKGRSLKQVRGGFVTNRLREKSGIDL